MCMSESVTSHGVVTKVSAQRGRGMRGSSHWGVVEPSKFLRHFVMPIASVKEVLHAFTNRCIYLD
jgi:hypothetical protein